jgi:hypothetical protein
MRKQICVGNGSRILATTCEATCDPTCSLRGYWLRSLLYQHLFGIYQPHLLLLYNNPRDREFFGRFQLIYSLAVIFLLLRYCEAIAATFSAMPQEL